MTTSKDEPNSAFFLSDNAPGATGRDRLSDEERRAIHRLRDDLSSGFVWSDSPQGYQFWSLVHRELLRNLEAYYVTGFKECEPERGDEDVEP